MGDSLKQKIVGSQQLSPQRKVTLLAWIESASDEQSKELETLLDEEVEIFEDAIFEANQAEQKASKALNQLLEDEES